MADVCQKRPFFKVITPKKGWFYDIGKTERQIYNHNIMISLVIKLPRISPTPESPEQEPKEMVISIGGWGFLQSLCGKSPICRHSYHMQSTRNCKRSQEIETFHIEGLLLIIGVFAG
jgi:hypothetical protein